MKKIQPDEARGVKLLIFAQAIFVLSAIFYALTPALEVFDNISSWMEAVSHAFFVAGLVLLVAFSKKFLYALILKCLTIAITISTIYLEGDELISILDAVSSLISIICLLFVVFGIITICKPIANKLSKVAKALITVFSTILVVVSAIRILNGFDVLILPLSETIIGVLTIFASICYMQFLKISSKALKENVKKPA